MEGGFITAQSGYHGAIVGTEDRRGVADVNWQNGFQLAPKLLVGRNATGDDDVFGSEFMICQQCLLSDCFYSDSLEAGGNINFLFWA